jgi:hypothetical protein
MLMLIRIAVQVLLVDMHVQPRAALEERVPAGVSHFAAIDVQ